jgi:hypothetical protein
VRWPEPPNILLSDEVQFVREFDTDDLGEREFRGDQQCSALAGAEIDESELVRLNRQAAQNLADK